MKTPRNAPCNCGSNKKWKKCCMRPRQEGIKSLQHARRIMNQIARREKSGYYKMTSAQRHQRRVAILSTLGMFAEWPDDLF